jgi:hypothetical protein
VPESKNTGMTGKSFGKMAIFVPYLTLHPKMNSKYSRDKN